jgi:DNA-binding transcriptional ArsR family regulator
MLKSIPDEETIKKASATLTVMGNPKRLQVLSLISKKEIGVGMLAEMVGLSQSALSQHLGKLRRAGLVMIRRDAQNAYYFCEAPAVLALLNALEDIAFTRRADQQPAKKTKLAV